MGHFGTVLNNIPTINLFFSGFGIFACKKFYKNDFLLIYKGDLLSRSEGQKREKHYNEKDGSFVFFFDDEFKGKCRRWW